MGGSYMVYRGIKMWEEYDSTLELMKEHRYSELKLLSLDVENLQRALGEADTRNAPEAHMTIQRFATTLQWARRREEAAAAGEEQARNLFDRASELQERYKTLHVLALVNRGIIFVILAVPGSLSIWFIESTIEKNQIDMDDNLGSSNGQLLALLVAVLTAVNFVWEVCKSKLEERKARKDTRKMVDKILDDAGSLQLHAGRQKEIWKDIADKASSAWRRCLSTVAPTEARRGRSVLGFKFSTWPRARGGDSEV
ncbi:hypothetical protein FVEG_09343 [Fusarium verticillioides 7600]|uniref:Uncharacterized protein n=1 Tax=Gibberella moniliformis (strain M3125 / FGSC 7600) TaxID=334819 RepID=W7MQW3_GIBM7|nr:hypothetical protein FVEG_09343 [Fusarium verticillioides 7600]EWG50005.1 hypothetical protein FVEG_09343 [Fusarium verticillioides 7600]